MVTQNTGQTPGDSPTWQEFLTGHEARTSLMATTGVAVVGEVLHFAAPAGVAGGAGGVAVALGLAAYGTARGRHDDKGRVTVEGDLPQAVPFALAAVGFGEFAAVDWAGLHHPGTAIAAWLVSSGLAVISSWVARNRRPSQEELLAMEKARRETEAHETKIRLAQQKEQQAAERHANRLRREELDYAHKARQAAMLELSMAQVAIPSVARDALSCTVERAFQSVGIHPVAIDAVVSELGDTRATVALPAGKGLSPEDVMRKTAQIANAASTITGKPTIRAVDNATVEITWRQGRALESSVDYVRVTGRSCREPVHLGTDENGEPVEIDFTKEPHALIAGAPGSGKTGVEKLLMLRLAACDDALLFGVDMKPGSPEFRAMESLFEALATTVDETRGVFAYLEREALRRGDVMASRGISVWDVADGPDIFLFVDEMTELTARGDVLSKEQKEAGEVKLSTLVDSALRLYRSHGIHLILATQQPNKDAFGGSTSARGNLGTRICCKVHEKIHGQFTFGQTTDYRPWDLVNAGEFLMQSPERRTPTKCRAAFVEPHIHSEVAALASERASRQGARVILPPTATGTGEGLLELLHRHGELTRKEAAAAMGKTTDAVHKAWKALEDGRVRWDAQNGLYSLVEGRPRLSLVKEA